MRKRIQTLGILFLLVFSTVIPLSLGYNIKIPIEKEIQVTKSSRDDIDWWPMFHHDQQHTGYSTSKVANYLYNDWTFETGHDVDSSPAVVDGMVYFGSDDSNIYCVNATNGELIWNYKTGDVVRSSPAVFNGMVYIGSFDFGIYCLDADPSDGIDEGIQDPPNSNYDLIWRVDTGGPYGWVWSSPAVVDGKVYVGSENQYMYCLNATDGKVIWRRYINPMFCGSPAVSGGMVYIGSYHGKLYCLNASKGNILWRIDTGKNLFSSPAVADGKVYYGNSGQIWENHNVFCVDADPSDGIDEGINDPPGVNWDLIWTYETEGRILSSPAVAYGKVYIGTKDECNIYCLNATDGKFIWNYKTDGDIQSSPAVADDKVYVSSAKMYCLNATDGKVLWTSNKGGGFSSPAVADGKVYIGGWNHKLYSFKEDVTPPECRIFKPWEKCLYLCDNEKSRFLWTIVLGKITVEVKASDVESGIESVKIFANNEHVGDASWNLSKNRYELVWDETCFKKCNLRVVANNKGDISTTDEMVLWYFNIKGICGK